MYYINMFSFNDIKDTLIKKENNLSKRTVCDHTTFSPQNIFC